MVISNDSEFGIDGLGRGTPPFQLHAKIDPAIGRQDDAEDLAIDTDRLDPATSAARTSTATVTTHGTGH